MLAKQTNTIFLDWKRNQIAVKIDLYMIWLPKPLSAFVKKSDTCDWKD
jgi:hypothetical protein